MRSAMQGAEQIKPDVGRAACTDHGSHTTHTHTQHARINTTASASAVAGISFVQRFGWSPATLALTWRIVIDTITVHH